MESILTVISIIVTIVAIFFGGKSLIKYIGRDDKSIKIGDDNKIKNSFNKDKSFFKKD